MSSRCVVFDGLLVVGLVYGEFFDLERGASIGFGVWSMPATAGPTQSPGPETVNCFFEADSAPPLKL